MLSQSRRQRQRLQRCRIYFQVGNKSHWNSRERVLEPEELSFLQATDSDTETREGAKRAAEGASPLTYAWANFLAHARPTMLCIHLVCLINLISPSHRLATLPHTITFSSISFATLFTVHVRTLYLPNPEPLLSLIQIPSTPGFSIGVPFPETLLLLYLRPPDGIFVHNSIFLISFKVVECHTIVCRT